MKVKIIKGTNQIGGCITQITSDNGSQIIIDYGEELTDEPVHVDFPLEGLTYGQTKYKGVFITHSHGDHIGLIFNIKKNIPIYIEETSAKIFEVANAFCSGKTFKGQFQKFKFEDKIYIDDFIITPYRTDHSAYNSTMFLIENNGKKVLHLGDYRSTGYSGQEFYNNLKKIGPVDLLITEGTNVTNTDKVNITEVELKDQAKQIFKKYKQIFILQASTNLDRLRTFKEAALETGKKFILDISTANILKAINDTNYDYLNEEDVTTWIPNAYSQNNQSKKIARFYSHKEPDFYKKYIEPFDNPKFKKAHVHGEYVMLVKPSMLKDIEINLQKYRDNAHLIYSMWLGYKDEKRPNTQKMREFLNKMACLNIEEEYLHTSGHADLKTIKEVFQIVNPKKAIGIHTKDNTKLAKYFSNYIIIKDNEEIEV